LPYILGWHERVKQPPLETDNQIAEQDTAFSSEPSQSLRTGFVGATSRRRSCVRRYHRSQSLRTGFVGATQERRPNATSRSEGLQSLHTLTSCQLSSNIPGLRMNLVVLDSTAIAGVTKGPGSPAYFSRYLIEHLRRQGHTITIYGTFNEQACAAADAVWAEWCNELAYAAAASNVCKRLIIRMRGYDVWGPLERLNWAAVDHLVFESNFIKELVEEQSSDIGVQTHVIPSGVDLANIPFRVRHQSNGASATGRGGYRDHPPVVALVARAVADKGFQLALEWARQTDIKLHVAAALGEANPRLMRYLQRAAPRNVTIHDTVDTIPWLESIHANFLLSASTWETLGYTIAEAMAMGIKPLIHDVPGAAMNWPLWLLWRDFDQLNSLINGTYDSRSYRTFVAEHLDAAKGSAAFQALLEAPSTDMVNVVEVSELAKLVVPTEPARLVFLAPLRGGPAIRAIRQYLGHMGALRFSATEGRTFVDFTPGPERRLLALDTIVRDDVAGLRRMLFSVLPHVDEIVIGIDMRSEAGDALWDLAKAYADRVHTFNGADIDMTEEAWAANKIDFSAARNRGRALVQSPWTLVLDSDEYLRETVDLRELVSKAGPEEGAFSVLVAITDNGTPVFEQRDFQRLARSQYRWTQAAHNQLQCALNTPPAHIATVIVSDTSLRGEDMVERRNAQRDQGIVDLVAAAGKGHLDALFHVAKHTAAAGDLAKAVTLCEEFRARVVPNTRRVAQRQWVALALGFRFGREGNFAEAGRWACRALLDGASVPAFCLLGDAAEAEGDLARAVHWYQAACAVDLDDRLGWPHITDARHARLAGLQAALRAQA
jgi:hypothetical protein